MRRRIIAIGSVILIVVLAIVLINRSAKKTPTTANSDTKTLGITTVVPTVTATETPETTPQLQKQITCQSVFSQAKKDGTNFMSAHKARNANEALSYISTPLDQDQEDQLEYWLGSDSNVSVRLYDTTTTSYATKSYSFGSIVDRGDDQDYRGTKRCQLTVHETRQTEVSGTFTEETVTRYLDFSLGETGDLLLTAFRSGKDGQKYSGFN